MRLLALRMAFFSARLLAILVGAGCQQIPKAEPVHRSVIEHHKATRQVPYDWTSERLLDAKPVRGDATDDLITASGERIPGAPRDAVTVELNGTPLR